MACSSDSATPASDQGDANAGADADVTADGGSDASTGPAPVYGVYFMHSEDPAHPETSDYMDPASWDTWVAGRKVLVKFAERMHTEGLTWDFQPDWNLTNAVLIREISRTVPDGHTTAEIDALLAESGGKNLYRYLSEDMGVQIDPHSHEAKAGGDAVAYNYADVAHLIEQTGVTPTGIVGGHVLSGSVYQNWPRFKAPVAANHDPSYTWTATAVIGGGTSSHVNETFGSGIWHPTEPGTAAIYDNYWLEDSASSLPAVGNWHAPEVDVLISQRAAAATVGAILVVTGTLDHSDLISAACGTLVEPNDRIADISKCDYDAGVTAVWNADVAPLLAHTTTGDVKILSFNGLLETWSTDFAKKAALCSGTACTRQFPTK